MDEFFHNVKIFNGAERLEVQNLMMEQFLYNANEKNNSCIIIIVPIHPCYQLKNYIVHGFDEYISIQNEIFTNREKEIWLCTNQEAKVPEYSGRFSIDDMRGIETHILEYVPGNYPRRLELVTKEENCEPLMRNYWGMPYIRLNKGISHRERSCETKIIVEIEQQRENIERFQSWLKKLSISSVSFDFKLCGDSFTILDWDIGGKERALRNIIDVYKEQFPEMI